MKAARFQRLSLRYGCHHGDWRLDGGGCPTVICGPNGSGKTTLVDGLVRTLFGFHRRRDEDAHELASRRPWAGQEVRGRLVLTTGGRTVEIRRDFETDRVRVLDADRGEDMFLGDGNPAGQNQEARQYRRILRDLLGLDEADQYRRTLLIRQGALPDDEPGDHLLRIAAGGRGHSRVRVAREAIRESHRQLTLQALHPAGRDARKPRELEEVERDLERLEQRLERARHARERRAPLMDDRRNARERVARLDREVAALETALVDLSRTETLQLESRDLRRRVGRLERAAVALEQSATGRDGSGAPPRHGRALAAGPARAVGVLALVLLGIAGGAAAAGAPTVLAVALAGAGSLAAAAAALVALAARRRGRSAREGRERVRSARRQAMDGGRTLLLEEAAVDADYRPPEELGANAAAILRRRAEVLRERIARRRLELDRIGDVAESLPDGMAAATGPVREALRERRSAAAAARDDLDRINRQLLDRGTPSESVDALRAAVGELRDRRARVARRVETLEAAHALIADAYESFRARDQERLAAGITRHLRSLSGGRLDELLVRERLDDARVRCRSRSLPLRSPPLSFGQLHTLHLAVRLGAADFLAGAGILPPLIIDEPFAHLDAARAAAAWRLLQEVASERQVILTTQDERLLAHLEINPDIRLAPPPAPAETAAARG